jgi:hypothetical protein
MAWSDYIPFLGSGGESADKDRSTRIRAIVEDIRNRHELAGDDRPLADIGRELESVYGDSDTGLGGEQATPGWRNAAEYQAATQGVDDLQRQGFMSPARYEYMQNAGRDVDFLSNVEGDPEKALYYWDRSNGARSTRESLWGPNYQRYSPWSMGAMATVGDRRSVIAKYLQNMSIISNGVQDWLGGTPAADAAKNAWALNQLQQRANISENPVGTLPEASPDATYQGLSREWQENNAKLRSLQDLVSPRSGQYVASRALGTPVPRVVGDVVGTVASMADPTLLAGLAKVPLTAALPAKAAIRSPLSTAGAYARGAAGHVGREAQQEMAFGGLLGLLLSPSDSHTTEAWKNYLVQPEEAPDTATEDERRAAASEILSPSWLQNSPKIDRMRDWLR